MLNRLVSLPRDGDDVQMKDLRTGYVQSAKEGMRYCPEDVRRLLRTHNTVEDEKQRPTERVGGLFTYEAIRAGQTFRGTVRMSAVLWKKVRGHPDVLKGLACGELSIGQSRKDEYGAVSLEYVSADTAMPEGRLWSPKLREEGGKNYLVVYLLSDLLIRGAYLNYSLRLDDLKDALSAALGVELQDVQDWEAVEGRKGVRKSPLGGSHGHCVRVGRRESWQTRWGLPRPSLSCFQAGGVLLFQVTDPEKWDTERARKLVQEGLGDRRAEGYGRVLLNPPFLCGKESGVESVGPSIQSGNIQGPLPAVPQDCEDRALLLSLAEALFKKRFRQAARQTAYALVGKGKNEALFTEYGVRWKDAPNLSQFGILREFAALIGDARERSSLEPVEEWLKLSPKNANGEDRESWKKPWRDWVGAFAKEPGRIWELVPAFQDVQGSFLSAFPDSERERLTLFALAAFWDVFCEAVFDKKKEESA